MATEKLLHAITKHVMGDRSEFDTLKKRFQEDLRLCTDKSTAAALAYMIAKDELQAEKGEEEEEPDVYDEVIKIIKEYCHPPGNNSAHTAVDEIFTLIYEWLDDSLAAKGYYSFGATREPVKELFQPFIIEKPKA